MREPSAVDHITEATRRLDVAPSTLNAAFARDVGISVPDLPALENPERQAVGRFLDAFIDIVERAAAEACAS